MKKETRTIEQLISDFCENILTQNDVLDHKSATNYIESLNSSEISLLNSGDLKEKCSIVRNKLVAYIQSYQAVGDNPEFVSPFEFDSGNNLIRYKEHFEKVYKKLNNQADIPKVFSKAFELIQEMSEHYRVFEQFYIIRSRKADDTLLKRVEVMAENKAQQGAETGIKAGVAQAIEEVYEASKEAVEEAKINSVIAAEKADEASQRAAHAAEIAVEFAVEQKMSDITKNISETSVTILGIFAGIVLTVVAGLFYSSSVLDNINSANFCRLISISALIGFVCYSLIALMFRYIERLKYDKDKAPRFSRMTTVVSMILLSIMLIFGGLQYCEHNDPKETLSNESMIDVNITATKEETLKEANDPKEDNIKQDEALNEDEDGIDTEKD